MKKKIRVNGIIEADEQRPEPQIKIWIEGLRDEAAENYITLNDYDYLMLAIEEETGGNQIPCTVAGIEFELTLDIDLSYTPEEPMVMYDRDGSGYPGCGAEISEIEIDINGIKCSDMFTDFIVDKYGDEILDDWIQREIEIAEGI